MEMSLTLPGTLKFEKGKRDILKTKEMLSGLLLAEETLLDVFFICCTCRPWDLKPSTTLDMHTCISIPFHLYK